MARTNTTTGGGGGGGAWSSITGTPTEVAYFDLAGNGTSDSLFTRDSVTNETFIGLTGTDLASNLQITPTGNTLTWDADTTGTIQTKLEQLQDILGLGLMSGSALTWSDSSTNLVAFNGSVDATGLGAGPATSILATFDTALGDSASVSTTYDTVTSSMLVAANARTGAIQANVSLSSVDSILNYRTGVVGQESTFTANAGSAYMGYQATTASDVYHAIIGDGTFKFLNDTTSAEYMSLDAVNGNTITWDANTGDTIITKLEQNEDILGLGGLAGSALTWEDSSTQVQAFIGAVDASAVGLFPGSVLMVTNDNATGASANISTNYDNVLNVATAVANAANGNFDSGFEFDDGRMIVRYRNTTTGFESAFESDISGALTRYKLNTASDEYSTQLGNGVFQFFNSTTADQYMSLGGTTGIFQFGDISGASNDTKFIINDSAQIITNHVDGVFTVEDGAASSIAYIDAANRQSIFGNVSAAGGIKMFIDDSTGINIQAPGATINIGANGFGNDSTIQIDDTAETISVTKPFTLKGYTVATLPTGVVGQTAYVTDALAPAFGATVAGSGAVTIPVFFNGTNWIVG